MKALKQTVRKYYKYVDNAFVQPTLSSNGTLGGNSFAVEQSSTYSSYYAYKMFDNNSSTTAVADYNSAYFTFYNPKPLNVTAITIKNDSDSLRAIQTCKVSVSNDNTTYTDIYTYTDGSSPYETWTIDLSSNTGYYKYYKVTVLSTGGHPYEIIQTNITATYRTIEEGTSSDYDFYEDVAAYKGLKKVVRHYYKYTTSNLTLAGSPTVSDGIISGFSSSNYALFPNSITLGTSNFELVFKVKPESTGQIIPFAQTNVQFNTSLLVTASTIYFRARNDYGNAFAFRVAPSVTLSTTSFTYIKITRIGNNFDISIKNENDDSYSSISTFTSSASIQSVTNMGGFTDSGLGWQTGNGAIDLKECYIKINGGVIWKGMNYVESTVEDYDFYKDVDEYSCYKSSADYYAFNI